MYMYMYMYMYIYIWALGLAPPGSFTVRARSFRTQAIDLVVGLAMSLIIHRSFSAFLRYTYIIAFFI